MAALLLLWCFSQPVRPTASATYTRRLHLCRASASLSTVICQGRFSTRLLRGIGEGIEDEASAVPSAILTIVVTLSRKRTTSHVPFPYTYHPRKTRGNRAQSPAQSYQSHFSISYIAITYARGRTSPEVTHTSYLFNGYLRIGNGDQNIFWQSSNCIILLFERNWIWAVPSMTQGFLIIVTSVIASLPWLNAVVSAQQ